MQRPRFQVYFSLLIGIAIVITACSDDKKPKPPTCTNGVLDGNETDIDCGGSACPTCDTDDNCNSGTDCTSGVCGASNNCPTPPCTCQAATCSDGVMNQDEHDIDCAGVCLLEGKTCPPGVPCTDPSECTSGYCNDFCQSSSCLPADDIENGLETDVDCGGIDCPKCDFGQKCLANTDCTTGFCGEDKFCQQSMCGNGTLEAGEQCDDNDTPYPDFADDLLGDHICADFLFAGGDLVCSPSCTFDFSYCTEGCGNGVQEGDEQCDGNDLDNQNCNSMGYDDGPGLVCSLDCNFDTSDCTSSSCPSSCPPGAYCSADTNFLCKCPIYQTACIVGCVSLLTDPNNCGSCGNICAGDATCSAGECKDSCPEPLVKCGNQCINPQIDSTFCGASGDCVTNNGSDCAIEFPPDGICLSGVCVDSTGGEDFTNAGDADTRCVGGGPVLDINTGTGCDPLDPDDPDCVVPPSTGCTGDLATVTFRYALCSCTDINTSHPLFVDGFNSLTGPYDPSCEDGTSCTIPGSNNGQCTSDANGDGHTTCADQTGAGIGANGNYDNSQLTTVWGTLWLSDGDPANYPNQSLSTATIEQNLYIGSTLSGGPIRVRGNGYVVGSITATGVFDDTLYQSSGTTSNMSADTVDRSANPLIVPEACDCTPSKLIDVPAIVEAHACQPDGSCDSSNNHNSDIGLDPTLLDDISADVRLDLPCGNYYFTNIKAGNNTTVSIVVHGRTAIYVGSHIDIPKTLNISLTDAAELDVFIKGGVCNNDTIYVGSPSYPARVRFYVGGGTLISGGSGMTCAQDIERAMSLKAIVGAANLYAPYGEVYMPQTFTLYGSIFAGRAYIVQSASFHFDTAIAKANQNCDHCGDGVINPGEECDGTALGGNTCESLGYTGGPLLCTPSCHFDTRACCGDGVRGGVEECDGEDLNNYECSNFGQTGTLSCASNCTFQGCNGTCNHNGTLETANGEECDQGDPTSDPDIFPSDRDTCNEVLGITALGDLVCTADCKIDASSCTYCGDGLLNGSEECDGTDFDSAPGVQNSPPACETGNGVVTCSAACALDTSGCVGCTDCHDCNNQACIDGTCGACIDTSQCCAPYICINGVCVICAPLGELCDSSSDCCEGVCYDLGDDPRCWMIEE